MAAEADATCGAAYGTRSPERTNSRNGYRTRDFDTRAGTIELAIPKLREGSYFPDWLLERRQRAERALISVVATCYLLGVSTRRMEKLVEHLGITRLCKSQVSVMARELDAQVADFRSRPLDAGPYTFLAADALTMKVREGGRVVNVHVLTATGVNADGHREILGIDVTSAEDGAGWLAFFRDLTVRGLSGVSLVTSDAHSGLVAALGATLPGACWQRCRTHYAANLMAVCPEDLLGMGESVAALGLRPTRRHLGARPVRADRRRPHRETPQGRRAPRGGPTRHPRLHRLPQGAVAADLVQQPPRAAEPRNPPENRRGRHLPRPQTPSSVSSAPSWPNNTTNGPKAAATSASTSSAGPDSPRSATQISRSTTTPPRRQRHQPHSPHKVHPEDHRRDRLLTPPPWAQPGSGCLGS